MLLLRLLGSASLEGWNGPLSGAATQRHRLALLALLARSPGGCARRDWLVALLWPGAEPRCGRHSLRTALHALRRTLGRGVIQTAGQQLRLNPRRIRCDVIDFSHALEQRDWKGVIRTYQGPFLSGLQLRHSRAFGQWVDEQRDRIDRDWEFALEKLAEAALQERDLPTALHCCRILSARHPWSARRAIDLATTLEAAGETPAALQQVRRFSARFRTQIGSAPEPALLALERRLSRVVHDDARTATHFAPSTAVAGSETPCVEPRAPHRPDNRKPWRSYDSSRAASVRISERTLRVGFADGRTLLVPLRWFPRVLRATRPEQQRCRLTEEGRTITWPQLDVNVEVTALLAGPQAPPGSPDRADLRSSRSIPAAELTEH